MAKNAVDVKNSELVGKTSSSRDSRPDEEDPDTVLLSSDAIKRARAAAESVTSETATVDRHPIILDDSEEDTDRFFGNDASSSGLVAKSPGRAKAKPEPDLDPDPETSTDITLPKHLPAMLDAEEEIIEISDSGLVMEVEPPAGKQEPRATITEVREVVELTDLRPKDADGHLDDDTATSRRPKPKKGRFDDETMPIPKAQLVDMAGALETVPLNSALVQNVLAQVDARAAARAAGQPVPQFQAPTAPPVMPQAQAQPTPRQHAQAATVRASTQMATVSAPPPRKLATEILITVLAFLFVAVPALYYLWISFTR